MYVRRWLTASPSGRRRARSRRTALRAATAAGSPARNASSSRLKTCKVRWRTCIGSVPARPGRVVVLVRRCDCCWCKRPYARDRTWPLLGTNRAGGRRASRQAGRGRGTPHYLRAHRGSTLPGPHDILKRRASYCSSASRSSFPSFEAISAIVPVVRCTSTTMLFFLGFCCTISHASHRPPFVSTA